MTTSKLYNLPRNSYIRLITKDVYVPPDARSEFSVGEVLHFHNVDGAYSYITDKHNNVVHLSASTEVEVATEEDFLNQ